MTDDLSDEPAQPRPNGKLPIPRPPVLDMETFERTTELESGNPWPVRAASLAGKAAPPRFWQVPGMVPGKTVTMLGGDGGVGKSTVAEMLAVATVANVPWLGISPQPGSVLYASAEDDLDELHRRLQAIAGSYGVDLAVLTDLHLLPLAGFDAVLAAPDMSGQMAATQLWLSLGYMVQRFEPRLLILDTCADVFGGNEIDRRQVRQFISMLRGLAIKHDLAVLLLSHPSLTGLNTGTGTSGSTAWNNSVRSRLYLDSVKSEDGREIDRDLRVLSVKKSNYGPTGTEIRLRWFEGVFILEDGGQTGMDGPAAKAREERIFYDLVVAFNEQGRNVSPSRSPTYAPTVFASHPDAEGLRKGRLEDAMNRLLKEGRIKIEPFGPKSKERSRLVAVPVEDREGTPGW
jgi:RecA-family ATPase